MNMRNEILKEHSRKQAERIARYALSSPARFGELFGYFSSGEYRLAQRAAYALMVCADERPGIVVPYIGRMLKNLERPGIHDAIKRNTIRVLQNVDIPARYQGRVAQVAFDFLNNRDEPVAIRVFAMTVIFNLSKLYPELGGELRLIIENELSESPKTAFKNRGTKILKALGKQ